MSVLDNTAHGVADDPTAPMGSVTRCVSNLLMHLSLSLSLLAGLASF
jgi:hypothetical protein